MKQIISYYYILAVAFFSLATGCTSTLAPKGGVNEYFTAESVRTLIQAAEENDEPKVKELINSGTNVNYIGKNGWTPLLWLMLSNEYEGMKLLLKHGANPNLITWDDNSAVTLAAGGSHLGVKTLDILLNNGGDPNAVGHRGDTALIIAIERRYWSRMRMLLKHGADIDKMDSYRTSTPLTAAAFQGQYEQVHYLLEQGADYTVVNHFGKTLAHAMKYPIGDASPWKKKVQTWLEGRGITFPAPKLK